MKTSRIAIHARLGLPGVALIAVGIAGGDAWVPDARAESSSAETKSGTAKRCVLKGSSHVAKGIQLFDAPSGGRVIASFTGNTVPMQMTEIPADPTNSRAKLVTSAGSGALRVEGYVLASAIPVFTARDVPVMTDNVWIAASQKVDLSYVSPSVIGVSMRIAGSRDVRAHGRTTCDGLSLQRGSSRAPDIPPSARSFLTKGPDTEIYDRPNGSPVFSFMMMAGTAQLFWSTESRGGFVHVNSHADLVVNGWVRWRDLDPIKKGEIVAPSVQTTTTTSEARLMFDEPPRIATATKDIPIRAIPSEEAKLIGAVETGAQFYVMETGAGWTNVLPRSLGVLPPDDGGFWIPASEVPR